jgi:hypothetical protein
MTKQKIKPAGPGRPTKYGEKMPVYTIRLPYELLKWCRQKGSDFIQNVLRKGMESESRRARGRNDY